MIGPPRRDGPVAAALAGLVVAALLAGCDTLSATSALPSRPIVAAPSLDATPTPESTGVPGQTATPTVGTELRAIVPVVGFRLPWTMTDATEVADVVAGAAGSGKVVMRQLFDASGSLLPW